MEIIYETKDLIVVIKPVGALSEESGEKVSVPRLLRQRAEEIGEKDPRFFTVHRLDRAVGGVMVLAKNEQCAARLAEMIKTRQAQKEYYAVVRGAPPQEGTFEDLLFRDSRTMKTYVVNRRRAGVKDAKLSFVLLQMIKEGEEVLSLVRVHLFTGRTHQIRVQFASRGYPLIGDGRYGSGDGADRPALFACRLYFPGLFDLSAKPGDPPFDRFSCLAEEAKTV